MTDYEQATQDYNDGFIGLEEYNELTTTDEDEDQECQL